MSIWLTAWRFGRRRPVPLILQAEMLECGHACLAMVGNFYGQDWTLEQFRERFTPSTRGTSLSALVAMAQSVGLNARIFRAEPGHLARLSLPCILHWDVVHFVVLESIANHSFTILDPALGRITIDGGEFDKRFTGIAIELSPGADFRGEKIPRSFGALHLLVKGLQAQAGRLLAVGGLALALEVLAMVAPLFVQAATDSIIPASDVSLLVKLTCGFLAAACLHTLLSLCRSNLLMTLGEQLSVSWNASVCARLLRLPYAFFVRRSISDINSRFASLEEIKRVVTHRFVEGALDGLTAIFSLVVICLYSSRLGLLTSAFTLAYGMLRVATLPRYLQAVERNIHAQSSQQGLLLEILHGIHSIKATGTEAIKLARFTRRTSDAARSTVIVQRWSVIVDDIGQLILRLHWICAVAAASMLVMNGEISTGMLIAYLTYALQFSTRSAHLVDLVSEWRTLKLHSVRLADIVAAPPTSTTDTVRPDSPGFRISVCDLSFRYDADGPWILNGANLDVTDGDCIAIKGPSGTGKSTLAKLMLGLLEPDRGTIYFNGVPIKSVDREYLRESVACVLQDDQLFNGTIAENIAFFTPDFSRADVVRAAALAQIHNEVMNMPLRYDTRIVDLGASLSGGQRQRLMLARALYRQPRVLILDEASSHLDLENERLVNEAISKLSITRIIIAHRPQTLAIANRVYELLDGTLEATEASSPSSLNSKKSAAPELMQREQYQ
jgi:ATP-binding cassette, subfamily B, bacterial CvaB/MchF/RaxB